MNASVQLNEYFSRQTSVAGIGAEGLEKLQLARVAVVGVGGVGSAAADYLTRAGVGHLRLIDQDIVEVSNLPRMHGTGLDDLYLPKAEVVAQNLTRQYPWSKIEPVVDTLRECNIDEMLGGRDLIVDGLDNFRTRYALNRFSSRTRIPYLFTSAIANQGHVALFHPPETPCLECSMPGVKARVEESCEVLGVTPSIAGLVGAITASEATKQLLGLPTQLRGQLMTVDMTGPEFLVARLSRSRTCDVCNHPLERTGAQVGVSTMLCGERTANVIPDGPLNLDLPVISLGLPRDSLLTSSDSVLVYRRDSLVISLFRNGRVIVDGVPNEEEAMRVAREVWREFS